MNKKPTLREAINTFCLQCKQQDVWAVGNCTKTECALYLVRPNQVLLGKSEDDYDQEEVRQEVLDALQFSGLKEMKR
jgi:hypothetical protein